MVLPNFMPRNGKSRKHLIVLGCILIQILFAIYYRALPPLKQFFLSMPPTNINATDKDKQSSSRKKFHPPRICSGEKQKPLTWIMFMGDSNMRHTYWWWTDTAKGRAGNSDLDGGGSVEKSSTYGLDRTDLDFGGRWADQEYLAATANNETAARVVVRYSFRFLHGGMTEFVDDTNNWDIARRGKMSPTPEDLIKELNATMKLQGQNKVRESDAKQDNMWEGRVRPSDYAIWANKHRTPIDDNPTNYNSLLSIWKKNISPDVVILTQGWGGVPGANDIDIVQAVVRNNPETLFVWIPIYVTDRSSDRYDSYNTSGVYSWTEPNLRMVDLWDLVTTSLPKPRKGVLYHAPTGGTFMKRAMDIIWNEVTACM